MDASGCYALPLEASQTPADLVEGENRLDQDVHQLEAVLNSLPVTLQRSPFKLTSGL
jgi:hypothetical protein